MDSKILSRDDITRVLSFNVQTQFLNLITMQEDTYPPSNNFSLFHFAIHIIPPLHLNKIKEL